VFGAALPINYLLIALIAAVNSKSFQIHTPAKNRVVHAKTTSQKCGPSPQLLEALYERSPATAADLGSPE
jgi:hypothetical protein